MDAETHVLVWDGRGTYRAGIVEHETERHVYVRPLRKDGNLGVSVRAYPHEHVLVRADRGSRILGAAIARLNKEERESRDSAQ